MQPLPTEGLSYSWSNTPLTLEYLDWMTENADALVRAEIESWALDAGYTAEEIDEMVADFSGDEEPFSIPNLDMLIDALGDYVQDVHVSPDGFRGTGYTRHAD